MRFLLLISLYFAASVAADRQTVVPVVKNIKDVAPNLNVKIDNPYRKRFLERLSTVEENRHFNEQSDHRQRQSNVADRPEESDGASTEFPTHIRYLLGENWFVQWYKKFLEKIIAELDDWIWRLDKASADDRDLVACASAFNSFARHITSSWALQMIDSSTKVQSGLLSGNLHDLGQYDQCVNAQSPLNATDPYSSYYTGQHCLISFNVHLPNDSITLNGKTTKLVNLFGANAIPLTVAQCYPSACKRQTLEKLLNAILSVPDNVLYLFGEELSVDVSIANTDCHVRERSDIDTLEWTVAGIVLVFLFLAGFCTIFDYFYLSTALRDRHAHPHEVIIQAFSVYTNGNKLLSTNQPPDAMTALNGLKFFSIAWVVVGHRYRFLINQPLINLLDFPDEIKKWEKMILLSGPLSVDTFFLISGLLNMYTFSLVREKSKRFNPIEILVGYVHRYLRLTPAYLVMIGITASWVYRLGDGPYWDRLVGAERQSCRQYFWQNLVYLNNYLNPDEYCMMQSWYLSADMQMFWLSPLVVYPLWKWPIVGFVEVALLTIASILAPMLVSYFYDVRAPIPLTTDFARATHDMAILYLPTHTKSVSYVVGIMAGYILFNIKKKKITFRPNKVTLLFFWLVAAIFMLYAIFGGYTLYQTDEEYNKIYSAFYIGFYRFFWALGLVWIIIACITGNGGPVNTLLSWAPLAPVARLTYCIYLTHVAIILRDIASQRTAVYYTDYDQVQRYLGDLVISIGAAAVLSLLFEAPIMRVEKIIFGGGFRKTLRESHSHTA